MTGVQTCALPILIELIVVVAIIGLLLSVVLSKLGDSRAKANNTAIISNLTQIKNVAGLQYENMKGCYSKTGITCSATLAYGPASCEPAINNIFAETKIAEFIASAKNSGGTYTSCASTPGGRDYAIVVQYRSDSTKGWCVDSSGKSKEVTISANTQDGLNLEVTTLGTCAE